MTKQEIKDAIVKGIAGQGTNVDGGGYLPKILDAIVDLIPEGGSVAPKPTITTAYPETIENVTLTEAATALNVRIDDVDAIPEQSVIDVEGETLTRIFLRQHENGYEVIFGGKDLTDNLGTSLVLHRLGNSYSIFTHEL